ncbi:hypothetical protein BLNAU_15983 [Blattamonas nauphoetae]|uniref:Uncharacterized protein n=1 Tax=Blattamonas nauphoetae TaxID=2049346 RepID=A0ABQ9X9C0_9EUKA|nr:hypothetical protein BLNAU_15983 [Blattamonas nauphoetae]
MFDNPVSVTVAATSIVAAAVLLTKKSDSQGENESTRVVKVKRFQSSLVPDQTIDLESLFSTLYQSFQPLLSYIGFNLHRISI